MESKVIIYFFSGTGNAHQIALWFSEFAIKQGIDCQINDISKTDAQTMPSLNSDALLIFISPVHGFNYPKITLRFIERFPKGKNKVVLMNTRAGMKIGRWVTPGLTGIAFFVSSILLNKKGYKIVGQIPFDMPSNWISIHPALNDHTVKFIHQKNYSRVEYHANKIFSGKSDFHSCRDVIQDILISPISLGYYIVGRFAFAKSFYASNDCDHCNLCVKQCPVKAIKTVDNHPYWTFKCESCMKCMNSCPKKAIETAHGLFIVVSILSSTIFTFLLNDILKMSIQVDIVRQIISTGLFFALLWGLYKVQHLMLKHDLMGKMIVFSSLTHYKFWGRYKSISDKKWKNKT